MTETSYFWDGNLLGDANRAPYSAFDFNRVISLISHYDKLKSGVIRTTQPSYSDELLVNDPYAGAIPYRITIGTGAAIVDGMLYINDAAIAYTLIANEGYYLVGLGKTHAYYDQTTGLYGGCEVRYFVRGPFLNETDAENSLIHNDTRRFEIPLSVVYSNGTGSSIVFYDKRHFIGANSLSYGGGMWKIAEASIGAAGAASVVFAHIPAYFKDLVIEYRARSSTTNNKTSMQIQFNSDSAGANYETSYWEKATASETFTTVTGVGYISLVNCLCGSGTPPPSASASRSPSASMSPSASVSPSISPSETGGAEDNEPSSSISQSRSLSQSPSLSISPSASLSPSSSGSPAPTISYGWGDGRIYLPLYSEKDMGLTGRYKNVRFTCTIISSNTDGIVLGSGVYKSANALSRVVLTPAAGDFVEFSKFTLYGVR